MKLRKAILNKGIPPERQITYQAEPVKAAPKAPQYQISSGRGIRAAAARKMLEKG